MNLRDLIDKDPLRLQHKDLRQTISLQWATGVAQGAAIAAICTVTVLLGAAYTVIAEAGPDGEPDLEAALLAVVETTPYLLYGGAALLAAAIIADIALTQRYRKRRGIQCGDNRPPATT